MIQYFYEPRTHVMAIAVVVRCFLLLAFLLPAVSRSTASARLAREEAAALLELRLSLVRSGIDPPSSWDYVHGEDLCSWERVNCSSRNSPTSPTAAAAGVVTTPTASTSSMRVVVVEALHLSGLTPRNQLLDYATKPWHLNLSVFNAFQELRHLDISENLIKGSLESLDIAGLRRLKLLDLHDNRFMGGIPPSWATLSSLQHLDLSNNHLSGPFPGEDFTGLRKLKLLDLNTNGIKETPTFIGTLSSLRILDLSFNSFNLSSLLEASFGGLPQLRELRLRYNEFNCSLPGWFGKLPKIKKIDLTGSYLTGSITQLALSDLTSLQYLDLSINKMTGNIPPHTFSNLSSLKYLDLSDNFLEGSIHEKTFLKLTSLEFLRLSDNLLRGNFPMSSLANSSSLQVIYLSGNNKLGLEDNLQSSPLLFQLKVLALSRCNLPTEFLSHNANFFSSQTQLEALDLSDNNLSGNISDLFLKNNTKLVLVSLQNNSLSGKIQHLLTQPLLNMKSLDLSTNHIDGFLPWNLGSILPNLGYLNLSTNKLVGSLPSSFANMSRLMVIDLGNNHFSGKIPPQLDRVWPSLYYLSFSDNNLQGAIPSFTLPPMTFLNNNKLTGMLPNNWSYNSNLQESGMILDVHDNQLSGTIPMSIWKIPNLKALNVRINKFYGHIPSHICDLQSLRLLDLSYNNFSGTIPSCSSPLLLPYLNLANNNFEGALPYNFVNVSSLLSLNAIGNKFFGRLPSWLGDLKSIRILLLSKNRFEGSVPTQICRLQNLQILDLSENDLSGSVPPCLGKLGHERRTTKQPFHDPFWITTVISDGRESLYLDGPSTYRYGSFDNLHGDPNRSVRYRMIMVMFDLEDVQFSTKGNTYIIKGKQLSWMVGINLSSNKFTGEIPLEIGNLTTFKALNFSHNKLTGRIPSTFSNLQQIESLDLSHNLLSGTIPPQLLQLKFLSVFSVAYNNLSGCTPEPRYQFGTFNESSYLGNMNLHGPPLESNPCGHHQTPTKELLDDLVDGDNKNDLDVVIFYAVSVASFVVFFWASVAMTHFNQAGRRLCRNLETKTTRIITILFSKLVGRIKISAEN